MDTTTSQYIFALEKLTKFLGRHYSIINVCMVDFITKNVFGNVLEDDIRLELEQFTSEDIRLIPHMSQQTQEVSRDSVTPLKTLFRELNDHSLESLDVVSSLNKVFPSDQPQSTQAEVLRHFDRVASDKKMHEVVLMTDLISQLTIMKPVESIIDLGSGKGYLSHILAATNNHLMVLAVEGSDKNSDGAVKRKERLEKRWQGLLRRAICRSLGEKPPSRGKHWKSKNQTELDQNSSASSQPDDLSSNSSTDQADGSGQEKVCDPTPRDNFIVNNLRFVTQFVDQTTDIHKLMSRHFNKQVDELNKFGIFGLHTCGGLASSSIKIFTANNNIRFCCNVGCCYHLLDDSSFPLSSVLQNSSIRFGRNPLMLAAQPRDRSIANSELPDKSLLWRSILQSILLKHQPELSMENQQVGRLASKSKDFKDYVRKSIEKLKLDIQISDEEISSTFITSESIHRNRLNAFYQLRSLFAPLVEGLVLLDRLVFLLEQPNISKAHLVKLFDPVISPRCYAIIGIK